MLYNSECPAQHFTLQRGTRWFFTLADTESEKPYATLPDYIPMP